MLRFLIDGYESGATPSVRQVCNHFGWASPNAAHQHLRALAHKGMVELRGAPAATRILPAALKLYGQARPSYRKPAKEV